MKRRVARAFEAVYMSARFVREVRFAGSTMERGVRIVSLTGGTPGQWRELIGAVNRAECAKADVEVSECFDDFGRPRGRKWPGLVPRARTKRRRFAVPKPPGIQIPRERLIVRLRLDA